MSYSLTYSFSTGSGRHDSDTAQAAVNSHGRLLRAGAGAIVIRDARNRIVSLRCVEAIALLLQAPYPN